jgi:hypothetical protein
MISSNRMTDEDFEILKPELGFDGLASFLRLNRTGSGDYTLDRHGRLDGITINDILAEVENRRNLAT